MPLYSMGTPGKMVALYLLIFSSTSFKSRAFGIITMLAPDAMRKVHPRHHAIYMEERDAHQHYFLALLQIQSSRF